MQRLLLQRLLLRQLQLLLRLQLRLRLPCVHLCLSSSSL